MAAPSANLWDQQLFREHYSTATAAPAEPHFVPVPPLGEALAYVGALIEGLRAERPSDGCVRAAWSLCTDATKLQVHEGVVSTRGAGFLAMIDEWVGRLRRLRVGEASAFVVRVEHFEEDMREALQWLCLPGDVDLTAVHDGPYPRQNDTELSALASRNLRHYLAMEYQVLDELYGLAVNGLRLRADSQADSFR